MDKLVDILKKNKVVAGISAATLAIGALYFLTQKKEVEEEVQGEGETNTTKGDGNKYLEKAREIAKQINVNTVGNTNNYDMSTISQVLELSIELAGDEYVEVTLNNRKERRALFSSDIDGYVALVMKYSDDVENVIKKAQETILQILNIQVEDFEESLIQFMEKGHFQEIYMFQAAIRQKIKEKIKPNKKLTVNVAKDMIQYQLDLVNQQPEQLKQIFTKLSAQPETAQLVPSIFTIYLNDSIFEKYAIEEEEQMHFMTSTPEFMNDPEIIILVQQVEQAMYTMMSSYNPQMSNDFF